LERHVQLRKVDSVFFASEPKTIPNNKRNYHQAAINECANMSTLVEVRVESINRVESNEEVSGAKVLFVKFDICLIEFLGDLFVFHGQREVI